MTLPEAMFYSVCVFATAHIASHILSDLTELAHLLLSMKEKRIDLDIREREIEAMLANARRVDTVDTNDLK